MLIKSCFAWKSASSLDNCAINCDQIVVYSGYTKTTLAHLHQIYGFPVIQKRIPILIRRCCIHMKQVSRQNSSFLDAKKSYWELLIIRRHSNWQIDLELETILKLVWDRNFYRSTTIGFDKLSQRRLSLSKAIHANKSFGVRARKFCFHSVFSLILDGSATIP